LLPWFQFDLTLWQREKCVMSERIDRFCETLRVKLTDIEKNMQTLKAKIDSGAQTAEQDVRVRLDILKRRVDQDRTKVTAAQDEIKKWVKECKATTSQKLAEWKARSEKARLMNWADFAESYAAAAANVASAAVDEAERASLEAWLARKDAESAQGTKAA
jgi:hypothetical protein